MRLTFQHVKLVHTAIFVALSACVLYVIYSGATARVTTWTWVAVAAIVVEGVALAASGGRCPLTQLAERLGATDGSVADLCRAFAPTSGLPRSTCARRTSCRWSSISERRSERKRTWACAPPIPTASSSGSARTAP